MRGIASHTNVDWSSLRKSYRNTQKRDTSLKNEIGMKFGNQFPPRLTSFSWFILLAQRFFVLFLFFFRGENGFRRARFQTLSSVRFMALTELRAENSVSSSQPMVCVQERTHRVLRRTHQVCPKTH